MSKRPWEAAAGDLGLPDPTIPLDRTFEGFLGLEWLARFVPAPCWGESSRRFRGHPPRSWRRSRGW